MFQILLLLPGSIEKLIPTWHVLLSSVAIVSVLYVASFLCPALAGGAAG